MAPASSAAAGWRALRRALRCWPPEETGLRGGMIAAAWFWLAVGLVLVLVGLL